MYYVTTRYTLCANGRSLNFIICNKINDKDNDIRTCTWEAIVHIAM